MNKEVVVQVQCVSNVNANDVLKVLKVWGSFSEKSSPLLHDGALLPSMVEVFPIAGITIGVPKAEHGQELHGACNATSVCVLQVSMDENSKAALMRLRSAGSSDFGLRML